MYYMAYAATREVSDWYSSSVSIRHFPGSRYDIVILRTYGHVAILRKLAHWVYVRVRTLQYNVRK